MNIKIVWNIVMTYTQATLAEGGLAIEKKNIVSF